MLETISSINGKINDFMWGIPALIVLIGTGVLMTVLTKFFQFSRIGHWMHETVGSIFRKDVRKTKEAHAISQFQSLCTALSATIGTGNIAGIAYAITMGGPGAVFWMWIAAIVGMMTNFSENVLGIYFRRKNSKGEWSGGAMYYLRDGVGNMKYGKVIGKVLAVLFSIFALFASFGIGNMSQIVSIKESVTAVVSFTGNAKTDGIIISAILTVIAGLVILGGIKRIASANEKIVPFMAILYIIGSFIIIGMNITKVPAAFASIFQGAFSFKSVAGGAGGYVIMMAMQWGFRRGVFSNEAGLGSSVMVHSASDVKEPVTQGLWGIFEVFMDTIVVCTCTALVILTSGVVNIQTGESISGVTKIGLATEAFTNSFGTFGGIFTAVAVTLFAFSTCLGWSFYGTKAWEYLFGTKSIPIYKVIFLAAIFGCSFINADLAIDLSDTANAFMMVPNLIGVVCLSGLVVKITNNYIDRKIKGKLDLKPMYSYFPEIQEEQEARKDD